MSIRPTLFAAFSLLAAGTALAQIANDPKEAEVIATAQKPDSWILQQLGGKRITLDGQTLDLRLQYRLHMAEKADQAEAEAAKSKPAPTGPQKTIDDYFADPAIVPGIRAESAQEWIRQTNPGPAMASVRDEEVRARDGKPIRVRIYNPVGRPAGRKGPLPVLVYYHGGGWVIGNIEAVDRSMLLLADISKAIIVSVDYRLAPENPYPGSWNDAEDAFDWTAANATRLGGDAKRICVGGDSAGGNMSVVVTSRTRKAGKPSPACQLLYYAAVDNRAVPEMRKDYVSSRLFWQGFGLDVPFTEYVHRAVFPGMNLSQPEISPIFADDIAKSPPTVMASAGFDPLRDSDRAYAAKLRKAGVKVVELEYPSLRHGFMQHTRVTKEADRASRESAAAFGKMAWGLKPKR
jgi:acetyl esterase